MARSNSLSVTMVSGRLSGMAALLTSVMHKECNCKGLLVVSPPCSGEFSTDMDGCGSQALEAMAGELLAGGKSI